MEKIFYGKFEKADAYKNRRYFMSVDKEKVDSWRPSIRKRKKAAENKIKSVLERSFSEIYQEIFDTFIAFYDVIPMLVVTSSHVPAMLIEDEIYKIFKKEGKKSNETSRTETYELGIEKFPKVERAVSKARSVRGVSYLFPRFYVMGLVSHYDYFIHQIARSIIKEKPHIVLKKDISISYAELQSLDSVSMAQEVLLERELEKIMRDSHEDQLKWFSTNLDTKFQPEPEMMARFVELCERRNLFAHNGGKASQSYISKCQKFGVDVSDIKIGDELFAPNEYFEKAVQTLIEMAFQIVFVVWNKLEPSSGDESSKLLIGITYNLIVEEKYEIAIKLIEFVLGNKSAKMDEITRRTHLINCANAKKLSGQLGYEKMINDEDWSIATPAFLLAKAAILGNVDEFIELMRRGVDSNSVTLTELREWPVFRSMRAEKKVLEHFEVEFGEPLIEEQSKSSA